MSGGFGEGCGEAAQYRGCRGLLKSRGMEEGKNLAGAMAMQAGRSRHAGKYAMFRQYLEKRKGKERLS